MTLGLGLVVYAVVAGFIGVVALKDVMAESK